MQAKINHQCDSCNTEIEQSATITSLSVDGQLKRCTTEWDCPSCSKHFEKRTPFDTDLIDMSGFHSWVGDVQENVACIIIQDRQSISQYERVASD